MKAGVIGISAFIAMMGFASAALAGPPVAITVKNQSPDAAEYYRIGDQAKETYQNASPKPDDVIESFDEDNYGVQSPLSPDVNYARVYYSANGTTCNFFTSYVALPGPGSSTFPNWNVDATPASNCTATIIDTDSLTGAWSVEFVID